MFRSCFTAYKHRHRFSTASSFCSRLTSRPALLKAAEGSGPLPPVPWPQPGRPPGGGSLSRRAAPASCAAGEARWLPASAQVRAGGHRSTPTASSFSFSSSRPQVPSGRRPQAHRRGAALPSAASRGAAGGPFLPLPCRGSRCCGRRGEPGPGRLLPL